MVPPKETERQRLPGTFYSLSPAAAQKRTRAGRSKERFGHPTLETDSHSFQSKTADVLRSSPFPPRERRLLLSSLFLNLWSTPSRRKRPCLPRKREVPKPRSWPGSAL